MAKRVSSKIKTEQALRRRQVAQLRRAGWEQQAIADELGCGLNTVKRDIKEMVLTLHAEATADIDAWRSTQLEELQQVRDRAIRAFDGSEEPDKAAAMLTAILKAQEREARLLGLDVATPAVLVPVMSEERAAEIRAELPPRR